MNAVAPKGWCPTLSEPMRSGDGLLVRVKPPGAVLSATAARALATAALRDGSGAIELTNRASLQVRGLGERGVPPFAAAMVAVRLADANPGIERRRAVIAAPLAGDDPGVSRHAASIADAIKAMLAREPGLAALPSKFGFLVDGGGVLPVAAASADIRVLLDGDICRIALDGASCAAACDPAAAADRVARLALAFVAWAGLAATPPRRMRTLLGTIDVMQLFEAAGLSATSLAPPSRVPGAVGWLRYGATGRGAFGVGLPFGMVDAATLAALADVSERYGDATLRVTPWRALAIPGVTAPDAVRAAVTALGLIGDPADTRARVFACPGQPACASATVPTRADAALLATLGLAGTLHVSGCAKGCAHPTAAAITLVGEAGRYGIVRDGHPGDPPSPRGLTIAQVAAILGRAPA